MAIYRTGESDSGLRSRALAQGIEEATITRGMTSEERYNRETEQGITGAKNVVNLDPTVKEATDYSTLGGPVSGAAMSKLKAKKRNDKKTKEREMKRK